MFSSTGVNLRGKHVNKVTLVGRHFLIKGNMDTKFPLVNTNTFGVPAFWNMTPCRLKLKYQHCGEACCLYLQCSTSLALSKEVSP